MLSSEVGMKLMKKPLGFQGFLNFRIINRESQIRSQDGDHTEDASSVLFSKLEDA